MILHETIHELHTTKKLDKVVLKIAYDKVKWYVLSSANSSN